MSFRRIGACAALALVTASCTTGDDSLTTIDQALWCGEPFCGNSGFLGAHPVLELDESRTSFSPIGGLKIRKFTTAAGEAMRLYVDGFKLYGKKISDGTGVSGNALFHAKIQIQALTGETYELRIDSVSGINYYEGRDDSSTVTVFGITYIDLNNPRHPRENLCVTDEPVSLPPLSMFYQGDRYDFTNGDVLATGAAAEPWFNVACNEDSRWKLALMGYVEAAEAPGFHTDAVGRQTGLRAIRADYCGDGNGQTVLGTEVDWYSTDGWLELEPDLVIEAIWTENGAACVSKPRYLDDADDIEGCAPPPCVGLEGDWTDYGTWMTWVPDPV
jgi:hypothetical protein